MVTYNDDEEPIYEADSESSDVIHGDKVDMRVAYVRCKPWSVWVEFKGSARFGDNNRQLGADIVVILDISSTMAGYEMRRDLQKTAMRFFISKLRPIDRLSVVVYSNNAERLCPLRLMKTDAKEDVELLVNCCLDNGANTTGDIAASLRKALQVLDNRSHLEGRRPVIMLFSGRDATDDASEVPLGDVPIHIIAAGGFTPHVLRQIADKSNGGTFSVLDIVDAGSISNLRCAFSQCLAQLFTVAVDDLKLILTPPIAEFNQEVTKHCHKAKKEIEKVEIKLISEIAGKRIFQHTLSDVGGSTTVSLGHLYCHETRKFLLRLLLPWLPEVTDNDADKASETEDKADEVSDEKTDEELNAESEENFYTYRAFGLPEATYDEADARLLRITYSYSEGLGKGDARTPVVPVILETERVCGAATVPLTLGTAVLPVAFLITTAYARKLQESVETSYKIKDKLKPLYDPAFVPATACIPTPHERKLKKSVETFNEVKGKLKRLDNDGTAAAPPPTMRSRKPVDAFNSKGPSQAKDLN